MPTFRQFAKQHKRQLLKPKPRKLSWWKLHYKLLPKQWSWHKSHTVSVVDMIACNATDLFNGNWRQAEVWMMLFAGAVAVNTLAQGALRQVTQWPWKEHPTYRSQEHSIPERNDVPWARAQNSDHLMNFWLFTLNYRSVFLSGCALRRSCNTCWRDNQRVNVNF